MSSLLADVTFSTEAIGLVGVVVSSLVAAVVFNFRLLMKQHETHVADVKTQYDERIAGIKAACADEMKALREERDEYRKLAEADRAERAGGP